MLKCIINQTCEQKSNSICLNSVDSLLFKAGVNVPGKTAVPGMSYVAIEVTESPSPGTKMAIGCFF